MRREYKLLIYAIDSKANDMKRMFLFFICLQLFGSLSFAQLPSVKLKDLNGNTIDTAEIENEGRPIVISFFATWCKPCIRELKAISEVYDDWIEETGVKLIAISIDEAQNVSRVKPLVNSNGWEYEVLLDPNSDFAREMGVRNVPHLIILDKDRKIVESHSGYTDGSEDNIIDILRKLK